jgi:type I restriction enzyme S subunit
MQAKEAAPRHVAQAQQRQVPAGYKRTAIGIVPQNWDLHPIGNMGEVITGKALAVDAPGLRRPYLRTKNVFDGRIELDDVLTMPMTDTQFEQFRLVRDDVLLNEGQSLELVGRCAIYGDEYPQPCAIQNQLLRFRARAGVSARFAAHLFRYCQHTGVFARIALQTTSIAHLGSTRFQRLVLPWPSSEAEQSAIAEALSDVDGLLAALEALIVKKRAIKQATMHQLLTGETRLSGFSGEWETKRLGQIASIRNQKVLPSEVNPDTPCVELEHIGQGDGRLLDISTARNSTSSKYRFLFGDVLFGRLRSYLRKFWRADLDGICTTEIWPLMVDSNQADTNFLYAIVQTDRFIEAASVSYGTHMPRSDWTVVRNFEIRLPTLEEQTAIATVLSDMDSEITALEARRDKTRSLKQGMMQQLLTGRVRLI